jgi:hypothetical protein
MRSACAEPHRLPTRSWLTRDKFREEFMNRFVTLTASALSALFVFVSLPVGKASAQTASDLVGFWNLVAIYVEQGDKKIEPYGPNPKGAHIYDASGRFSVTVVRSDLPKFASNNRETGTAEENAAAVRGSIAYFGTYTTSEADKSVTVQIEGASYANFAGTSQKRLYSIDGDELTITNPTPSAGGGVAKIVLKRAKTTPRQM